MSRKGLWVAAALVVASNLGAFGLAALNRSGQPEAVLELTERELRLPAKQADNTALLLALVFDRPHDAAILRPPDPGWFDLAKLQSIGYDCSAPVTLETASHYRAMPPRSTYAVLEYEGETWRRQIAEPPPESLDRPQAGGPGAAGAQRTVMPSESVEDRLRQSHLVAIDVGNGPARLRTRYPDRRRAVIVEATAMLQFIANPGRAPFLTGRVTSVRPSEFNVAREWRSLLEGLQTERNTSPEPLALHEPRYRVTVKWGRNLEPWIADVRPMADTPGR